VAQDEDVRALREEGADVVVYDLGELVEHELAS
jgi:hypothetical protein